MLRWQLAARLPMRHSIGTAALAALWLAGCATQSAAQQRRPILAGPASRIVEIPSGDHFDMPRFVEVLADEPLLKLVSIVLWGGMRLADQRSDVQVTIHTLQGGGTVVTATERLRLGPHHVVILAPNVAHAVEADAGAVLVLLVHHLGRGVEQAPCGPDNG
jgi:quercetin dioxygenase-like cupin family protein